MCGSVWVGTVARVGLNLIQQPVTSHPCTLQALDTVRFVRTLMHMVDQRVSTVAALPQAALSQHCRRQHCRSTVARSTVAAPSQHCRSTVTMSQHCCGVQTLSLTLTSPLAHHPLPLSPHHHHPHPQRYPHPSSASLSGSSAQLAIKAAISGCLGPARPGAKAGPADVYFRLSEFYPFYPY